MRGKQQPDGDSYGSSLGLTILPGKANGGGNAKRKGKSATQPEAAAFFAPPETALTPAQFAPPTPVAVGAPAATPPAVSGYPAAYPAAPGFPPQPLYPGASAGQPDLGPPAVPPAGYTPINFLEDHESHDGPAHERPAKSRTPLLLAAVLVVALAAGGYYEVPKLLNSKKSSSTITTLLPKPAGGGGAFKLPATIGTMPKLTDAASLATAAAPLKDSLTKQQFADDVASALYRQSPGTDVLVIGSRNDDLNKDLKNLDNAESGFLIPGSAFSAKQAPIVGVNGTGWISCDTSDLIGLDKVDHGSSTSCVLVTAKVIVEVVLPSPAGADRSAEATAIAKQLG